MCWSLVEWRREELPSVGKYLIFLRHLPLYLSTCFSKAQWAVIACCQEFFWLNCHYVGSIVQRFQLTVFTFIAVLKFVSDEVRLQDSTHIETIFYTKSFEMNSTSEMNLGTRGYTSDSAYMWLSPGFWLYY